jgi:DNA-binding XRE family transcriptional regulator
MSTISKTTLQDWQEQQEQDPDFVAESLELEIGYQVARLRISQGLTQEELAERVSTRQPSIARLESGRSLPSLSFLKKIADALDAGIEVKIIPKVMPCKSKKGC